MQPAAGSQPEFRRPVVIVQADEFNRSRIRTVVAAVIASNLALAAAPGNVSLPARAAGLRRKSVVNVSQLVTLDKRFLVQQAGRLHDARLQELDDGLRLVLAL